MGEHYWKEILPKALELKVQGYTRNGFKHEYYILARFRMSANRYCDEPRQR